MPLYNVLTNPLQDAIKNSNEGGIAAKIRNILTFSAAGGQYGELNTPRTLPGDFEIGLTAAVGAATGSVQTLLSGETYSTSLNLYVASDLSSVTLECYDGATIQSATVAVDVSDGKIYDYSITRSGSTITLDVEGTTGTLTSSETLDVNFIAQRSDGSLFANLSPLAFTIRDAGSLVVDMDFNTDLTTGNVVPNKAATLGSELVSNGSFSNGTTGWSTPSTGNFSSTITESGGRLVITPTGLVSGNAYQNITVNSGDSYLVEWNCNKAARFDISTNPVYPNGAIVETRESTVGDNQLIFTAASSDVDVTPFSLSDSESASYDDISVREIPEDTPYLTLYNMTTDDSELFRRVGNAWVAVDGSPTLEYSS